MAEEEETDRVEIKSSIDPQSVGEGVTVPPLASEPAVFGSASWLGKPLKIFGPGLRFIAF
jgi:hypothetical protein